MSVTAKPIPTAAPRDPAIPDVPIYRLTVEQYHQMMETGILVEGDPPELLGPMLQTMRESGGRPEASVIGASERLPAPQAAFANGMLCHGLDFDDTHTDAVCHVSAVMAPAHARPGSES